MLADIKYLQGMNSAIFGQLLLAKPECVLVCFFDVVTVFFIPVANSKTTV